MPNLDTLTTELCERPKGVIAFKKFFDLVCTVAEDTSCTEPLAIALTYALGVTLTLGQSFTCACGVKEKTLIWNLAEDVGLSPVEVEAAFTFKTSKIARRFSYIRHYPHFTDFKKYASVSDKREFYRTQLYCRVAGGAFLIPLVSYSDFVRGYLDVGTCEAFLASEYNQVAFVLNLIRTATIEDSIEKAISLFEAFTRRQFSLEQKSRLQAAHSVALLELSK